MAGLHKMEDSRYQPWYRNIVAFVSGEVLLRGYRPNTGTVVLRRSIRVMALLFALLILVETGLRGGWWEPWDIPAIRTRLAERLPWAGAIFAGAYVAFYTRFASQWTYLAEQYNQIQAKVIDLEPSGDPSSSTGLVDWKVSFIHDAWRLHLARSTTFRSIVLGWLSEPGVIQFFENERSTRILLVDVAQLASDDQSEEDVRALLRSLRAGKPPKHRTESVAAAVDSPPNATDPQSSECPSQTSAPPSKP